MALTTIKFIFSSLPFTSIFFYAFYCPSEEESQDFPHPPRLLDVRMVDERIPIASWSFHNFPLKLVSFSWVESLFGLCFLPLQQGPYVWWSVVFDKPQWLVHGDVDLVTPTYCCLAADATLKALNLFMSMTPDDVHDGNDDHFLGPCSDLCFPLVVDLLVEIRVGSSFFDHVSSLRCCLQ